MKPIDHGVTSHKSALSVHRARVLRRYYRDSLCSLQPLLAVLALAGAWLAICPPPLPAQLRPPLPAPPLDADPAHVTRNLTLGRISAAKGKIITEAFYDTIVQCVGSR